MATQVTVPAPAPAPEGPAAPPRPPVRMSWPRRIVAALTLLAIAATVVASLRPRPPPPLAVALVRARRGPITRVVTAGGKLQAATEVKLSSNISGDLLALDVREGDRVVRGQVLGRIDARRYEPQVRQQEAARASAAADLDVQNVRASQLEAELRRVERLAASQNASAAELEKATSDLEAARAQAAAARQRVAQADAALREARHQLAFTTLLSPMDGVVTQRIKQVGERVRGSDFSEDVILVIGTLDRMEARIEVGENEVVYVKVGDPAEVQIDAFPDRSFPARVIEVARNATVKNAGTDQEVTTFIVRLALLGQVPGALPGMSAQASISTDTRADAVVVPIQAVTVRAAEGPGGAGAAAAPPPATPGKPARRERQRKVVFVVKDGVAHLRPVETGLASDAELEVTAGLQAGEEVVEGPYRILSRDLTDGRAVTEEKPPAATGGKPGP